MYESNNPAQSWFYAKVRWAVMVEGRGIREWKEAGILFRSRDDPDSAFRRALEIGEGYQGGCEEGTRRPRWVETRLAEVVTLDRLGEELQDETEVYWKHMPVRQKIPFEHIFLPAARKRSRCWTGKGRRCDGRGRRSALRRQKPAPQCFASAATVTSLFDWKSVCASRQTETAGGQIRPSKWAK
jgi:hypothetical protein